MRVCKKVDSGVLAMDSKETSAIAERYPLFCHETATALARNDGKTPKAQNVICKKVDRIKTPAKDSRIFAMILGVVECKARAHTWGM